MSAWAPLSIGVFRVMWLAVLASNVGIWMQTVGAQWLLVDQPNASLLVALVQAADTLPDVLFSSIGGVLADIFDRRRLLIIVQACLFVTGLALTMLTIAGEMPPALLLTFTLLLGAGSAFSVPAYQSLVPDLVPRGQVPAASVLGSVNINLARVAGPALAGIRTGQPRWLALWLRSEKGRGEQPPPRHPRRAQTEQGTGRGTSANDYSEQLQCPSRGGRHRSGA